MELAPRVRVNGVAPGAIAWPEDGQFDPVFVKELEDGGFLRGLVGRVDGQVDEADAVGLNLGAERVVVGDDDRNLGVKFTLLVTPEEVNQAMALAGDEQGGSFRLVGEADAPGHAVLAGQGGEGGIELAAIDQAEALALDDHAEEESAAVGGADELVGGEDVTTVQRDEVGHGGDQATVVGAVDQQAEVARGHEEAPALGSGC